MAQVVKDEQLQCSGYFDFYTLQHLLASFEGFTYYIFLALVVPTYYEIQVQLLVSFLGLPGIPQKALS